MLSLFGWGRMRTPTILQMDATECGPAALGILFAHYGRYIPVSRLREVCGASRDGSKAGNLLKAGRLHGLKAGGFRYELHHLRRLRRPAILHWAFNHFVVFEGMKVNGDVWINDPATGPRLVPHEEFSRNFTGVVLCFQPGEGFQKQGRRPALAPALLQGLKGLEIPLLFILLCSFCLYDSPQARVKPTGRNSLSGPPAPESPLSWG